MELLDPTKLWFHTPDSNTLCRAGGNGPNHPTQLYAIQKYVGVGMTLLDYGAGSATTYEALKNSGIDVRTRATMPTVISPETQPVLGYRGLDIIPKNVEWCKQTFPAGDFVVNTKIHEIDEPDQSWDVVYSRHVVDHMRSFEDAMDEHKRVAKKLVIVILWTGLLNSDEHEIKNIVDHRGTPEEVTYTDEYTNNYSRKKVLEYLESDPAWKLLELTENVGSEVKGCDTVLVLERV